MFHVISQKRFMYGDEVQAGEFDYDNPVATYEDQRVAAEHAQTHARNHGVVAIVVHQDDLEVVRKVDPKPMFSLGHLSSDGVLKVNVVDETPEINMWNTLSGKPN
jgi:hypothetical protein